MPACPTCDTDYTSAEYANFCGNCGERLLELSKEAARHRALAINVAGSLVLVALAMLGAGIALWFMGPAWFAYTETGTVRAISIGLMVGGPTIFVMAMLLTHIVRGPKPAETDNDLGNGEGRSSNQQAS